MSLQIKLIAALLALLALGAAFVGYGHHQYTQGVNATTALYEAAIDKQKAQAATLLASETAKTRSTELALQTIKNQQELQDADHQKTVADLSDRLRRLSGSTGRLRDPNAAGCGGGGGSATDQVASAAGDRADDAAQAGGLLSGELSGLLRGLASEADAINNAYASCRADAFAVRAQ